MSKLENQWAKKESAEEAAEPSAAEEAPRIQEVLDRGLVRVVRALGAGAIL